MEELLVGGGPLAEEPKVHILHGERLEAEGRGEEARLAFCRSYRVSADASLIGTFMASGVAALQPEGGGPPDLQTAESYFSMAACIDPAHDEVAQALSVVREAIGIRRDAERDAAMDAAGVRGEHGGEADHEAGRRVQVEPGGGSEPDPSSL